MLQLINRTKLVKVQDKFYKAKRFSRCFIYMMLDDTRCGLDASGLHRATSMYNYKVEQFGLLSCHRDTSGIAR